MKRFLIPILGVLSLSCACGSPFPTVSGKDLTGATVTLPKDLTKSHNLLAIAFQRDQQADVDTWIPRMEALEDVHSSFRFYEIPTIKKMGPFNRWIIYQGMRGGIPAQRARERTITLHLDKESFKRDLSITDESRIYLFLTDASGNILWRSEGRWTARKEAAVKDFLR